MIKLRYVGEGRWLPGVPADDHEVETAERAEELVASGLYERAEETKPKRGRKAAEED